MDRFGDARHTLSGTHAIFLMLIVVRHGQPMLLGDWPPTTDVLVCAL
jgi:hypothetical protein